MRDLLFLAVMLTMVPLSLRFPMVGVMGWAWTALLAPNDWLFSFMSGVPINKVFAGATMISMVVFARELRFRMTPTLWLVLCLLGVATVSATLSIDQTDAGWVIYTKFTKIVLFCFVIAAVVNSRLRIHALILAVALGVGFVGVSEGAFYLVSGGGHKIVGNPSVGDNNQLAAGLLVVLPLVLYLVMQSEIRVVKLIGGGAIALILSAVIGTSSRGALVGLVALAAYMVVNSRRKLAGFAAMMMVGLVILATAPESWFQRMDTITTANDDNSFMGRVIAWKVSTMIALDRPLFGGGFHAVQHPFAWALYGGSMHMLDFVPTDPAGPMPRAAHSIYFEVLGDMGFVGLGLFVAMLASMAVNLRRVRRLAREQANLRWAFDLAFALQGSLVAYMVAGAALSMAYVDLVYVLAAATVTLRQMVEAETRVARGSALPRPPPGMLGLAAAPDRPALR
ncbi:MAG: putative O-glycosylation ligase, exosortase A system-associated [Rhodospirillales bacterium 70-18]|nr:putative O-glycosylation ligase, exosortase A system-associated [Rhodospirillales bacterium]OJY67327.1 MAG: putative O-glycosylation ligase, exosortase A system-associated [Rhodospirillales bacterium 70-18]